MINVKIFLLALCLISAVKSDINIDELEQELDLIRLIRAFPGGRFESGKYDPVKYNQYLGRYIHNNKGKYKSDNRGKYQPDDRGRYRPSAVSAGLTASRIPPTRLVAIPQPQLRQHQQQVDSRFKSASRIGLFVPDSQTPRLVLQPLSVSKPRTDFLPPILSTTPTSPTAKKPSNLLLPPITVENLAIKTPVAPPTQVVKIAPIAIQPIRVPPIAAQPVRVPPVVAQHPIGQSSSSFQGGSSLTTKLSAAKVETGVKSVPTSSGARFKPLPSPPSLAPLPPVATSPITVTPRQPDRVRTSVSTPIAGAALPRQSQTDNGKWRILRQEFTRGALGYHYSYATENGIKMEEEGHILNAGTPDQFLRVFGFYEYIGDDGKLYTVNYVSDRDGFQPRGEHIPALPGQRR